MMQYLLKGFVGTFLLSIFLSISTLPAANANEVQNIVAAENAVQISLISLAQTLLIRDYKNFDIALSHNSNDIAIASLFLDIPLVTSFDYEHAYSHHINVRISKKVVIPGWIPNKNIYRYLF